MRVLRVPANAHAPPLMIMQFDGTGDRRLPSRSKARFAIEAQRRKTRVPCFHYSQYEQMPWTQLRYHRWRCSASHASCELQNHDGTPELQLSRAFGIDSTRVVEPWGLYARTAQCCTLGQASLPRGAMGDTNGARLTSDTVIQGAAELASWRLVGYSDTLAPSLLRLGPLLGSSMHVCWPHRGRWSSWQVLWASSKISARAVGHDLTQACS